MSSYDRLLARVRAEIAEVDPLRAEAMVADGATVVDVREPDETAQGVVERALLIPRGHLEARIEQQVGDKEAPIVVYCAGGARSAFAAKTLGDLGYRSVVSVAGGFNRWKADGRPWTIPQLLRADQRGRYSRHLLLPEVGEEGQVALLDARVLLVGAGGLGSPAALYLAAAGIGTLGIVDSDVVDESNLQRQVLHNTQRVGRPKVDSARETVEALNPDVEVVSHPVRLAAENVLDILDGYDVIVDGADNFPTRYLLNDASVRLGIPVVHGSIFRFEGQVSVFDPRRGPTYRDLLPQPPPPELAPNCATAGVLGVLPGIIGSIQALEVIKLVLDIGDPLIGRLLIFDALDLAFREYRLVRDDANPVTYDNRDRIVIADLGDHCRATLREA